ncbi:MULTISPECIES: HAD family hydrolase [Olivibacter]|jgi:putative hydrolase of the HAD superfamily|uniref:HAD-superfamily hydrolase, subfamily IA, variant 3 n=3 Tax=Sphingobacteriaceae TaxID=84566 RepID=F4CCZ7_SPHS2|nr:MULTISPECIES: HAD family phosphatase [Olivibacter]MCL4639914.1 HAD family phosphatase [Olivibacter sp. UJ_SKK_5.1]MDM8176564.1 HAD family phosphatase [Olivibacter sp. 47]MDX3915978.1 HAD family phosphatase [Pseudosphingobacterium sp.]QEL00825.1 HAD family phosphatase [Olivibacter sp. LS-1]
MQNIENIIFDYGNVIFMIDFAKAHKAFTDLGVKGVEKVFAHTEQNALFDDFDMGRVSAAQFRDGIREVTGKADLTDQQIDNAWNSLLIGVPKGRHELLWQLKDRYNTFLLSNNNEIHYQSIMEYLKKEHALEDNSSFFIKDYYSHLLGMRKPNSNIFEFVLQTHQLEPEKTLFIDDSPQHLVTAKKLGIQTELLTAPDTLELLVQRRKLL